MWRVIEQLRQEVRSDGVDILGHFWTTWTLDWTQVGHLLKPLETPANLWTLLFRARVSNSGGWSGEESQHNWVDRQSERAPLLVNEICLK